MVVYHDLKLIFIRVPKTGTNSFFNAMRRNGYRYEFPRVDEVVNNHDALVYHVPPKIKDYYHFAAIQAKTLINDEEIWETYEKIGFIRHPYDWVVSLYNKKMLHRRINVDKNENFSEFIKCLRVTPFSWFLDEQDKMMINKVYRTEDMNDVLNQYGCEARHDNRNSGKKHIVFTDENRDLIDTKFYREWKYYK